MKKNYLTPSIEITMIVSREMITSSMPLYRGGYDDDEILDESEVLSRSFNSVWDDDEE